MVRSVIQRGAVIYYSRIRGVVRRVFPLLFSAIAVGFAVYVFFFLKHLMDVCTFYSYIRSLNVDDAFYYFKIARNFADGLYSTFDGVNRTNGYHPLWMVFLIPFFLGHADPVAALEHIKILEILLLYGAFLFLLAGAYWTNWSAILLMGILPLLLQNNSLYNGMETAISLFALSILFAALGFWRYRRPSTAALVVLSCILFLLPWARLENLAVSLFVPLALFIASKCKWMDIPGKPIVILTAASLAGLMAYLLSNQILFSSPVPISGIVKTTLFSQEIWRRQGGYDFLSNLQATWRYAPYRYGILSSAAICVIAACNIVSRKRSQHNDEPSAMVDLFLLSLAVGHVAKFFHSAVFLDIYYAQYSWYLYFQTLMSVLLWPYLALSVIAFLGRLRHPLARDLVPFAGCVAGAVIIATAPYGAPFKTLTEIANKSGLTWTVASYMGTQVMNAALPEGAVIGSVDSGVIGYFSKHRVVNLDGLVNSREYYDAIRSGTVSEWLAKSDVTYLANALPPKATDGALEMGLLTRQAKGLAGASSLLYEGPPFYHKTYQLKLWAYRSDEPSDSFDSLPLDDRTSFFHELFSEPDAADESTYSVFLMDDILGYMNDNCEKEALKDRLFLRFFTQDQRELPPLHRSNAYVNIKFQLKHYGFRDGNRCMAILPLPSYSMESIVTGQVKTEESAGWKVQLMPL